MSLSKEYGVEKVVELLCFTRCPLRLGTMFRLVLISVCM